MKNLMTQMTFILFSSIGASLSQDPETAINQEIKFATTRFLQMRTSVADEILDLILITAVGQASTQVQIRRKSEKVIKICKFFSVLIGIWNKLVIFTKVLCYLEWTM